MRLTLIALAIMFTAACGGGNDSIDILDSPASERTPSITVPGGPSADPAPPAAEQPPPDDRVWVCATVAPGHGRTRPIVFSDVACPTDREGTSELGESGIIVRWYAAPPGTPVPPIGAELPGEFPTDA